MITDDCIKGNGRYYQGTVNVTKSGKVCQRWDAKKPHVFNPPPNVFPEMLNAENYCRNAGGEVNVPWCYTMDPDTRWQACDIPVCSKCTCSIIINKIRVQCVNLVIIMRNFL